MITVQGTIPYPPTADSRPIQALATNLRQFSTGLGTTAGQLAGASSAAQGVWTGAASRAFASHTDERARTVASVAQSVGNVAPVLETLAAAIDSTSMAYSTAAMSEHWARAGLPWTAGALAAAIAEEAAALAALQAAGLACAGGLVVIELEIAAAQFFGVNRETFVAIKDAAVQIWDGVSEAFADGDFDADALVKALNTTIEIPNADGGTTRLNAIGWLLDQNPKVRLGLDAIQAIIGTAVLLTTPPLTAVERPDLVDELRAHGFDETTMTGGQIGTNMALLEALQRRPGVEVDQSMAVFHTFGVAGDGSQVLNLTLPGIVPPNEAFYGDSGQRNLPNASASQITGFGGEEDALVDWVRTRGLQPGDTVNIYAHSQGGIVGRNVANDLITRGYRVNVVSYGSPDGQFREGIGAYVIQNDRDPVPAARLGGDAGSVLRLHPGQHLIQFDHELPEHRPLFDHHNAETYGAWIDANPNDPRLAELRAFLDSERHVVIDPSRSGVTTFEGPRNPAGEPVTVPEPYEVRGR
jgi:uncharacterized protein YukE